MPSPFTLRPKVDTAESDNWTHSIKSHPSKDYWEHIFEADDDIYMYSADDEYTIGTLARVSENDIPSISSADGKLTNITGYGRGKIVGSGSSQLHARIKAYGGYVVITEGDEYVTKAYVCTQYLDLEDDLWTLDMGGHVLAIGVNVRHVKYFDHAYAIVNYVPAPPTCVQQSITLSEDGKTLIVKNTRYEYCTWLKAWGYQLRVKDSEDILYTDRVEGVMKPWKWWEGAYNVEREIDVSAYVRCGVTYEARGWAETDDGIGYCPWIELSFPCPEDFPLAPVLFPAQLNKDTDELRQKCRNFEESMSDVYLVVNHNTTVTRRYLQETYGDTIHPESSNLRFILPSQQLVKLSNKNLVGEDFKAIINNFITNISNMFILINENNTLIKAWLDDYEPDEAGHEFTNVKMRPMTIGEDLSKTMDNLFEGIVDNVTILNMNLEVLKERF